MFVTVRPCGALGFVGDGLAAVAIDVAALTGLLPAPFLAMTVIE
jgi:hypothetical protein